MPLAYLRESLVLAKIPSTSLLKDGERKLIQCKHSVMGVRCVLADLTGMDGSTITLVYSSGCVGE